MFGMMMYELLSDHLPFYQTSNILDVAGMIVNGERPTIPVQWDNKVIRLLEDCWRVRPEERPNMDQVAERLETDRNQLYADFEDSYVSADGLAS